ncbi:Glycoprotein-N-acetylgalactosamine 3-beta-galactosyltransferase 1-B [Mizuhopecten yessoensis]|uniref:N-acetylgalactosaminide beta-1,3-galactosyltransferase n=2 Tax=Mizuhopecten yessoensis TaxID=6573 RepID=A0A210PH68_MIZYE|nr:Glycoprotein-N-acetylgalactosamine 3-beta-galactosyltransferase 1-B [Mizuhopecten yessoensis]
MVGSYVTFDSFRFVDKNKTSEFGINATGATADTGQTQKPEQEDKYGTYTNRPKQETWSGALVDDSAFHKDKDEIARDLKRNIRVLCMIMTSSKALDTKATNVKNTWAKRCNVVVYISSTTNTTFPTVGFDIPEGREHLTAKTMTAFRYIFEKHFNEADWFIKIDDDSFVILENLRYFLSSHSPNDAVYFGHSFKSIVKQGFYCAGGGHVLSKEALRRLAMNGVTYSSCQYGAEVDVELGKCMEYLGVETADSTDRLGRSRFHCFDLEKQLSGEYPGWYYQYDVNGAKQGMESISDYAISFHVVPPLKINMYKFEFYVYHLRPYGIDSGHQSLNVPHTHL